MKKTGIIVGLIVLLGLGGIAGGYYYFVQRPNITVGDDGIIFIQPGDSFETVMTTLISSGYVQNEYTLRKLAERRVTAVEAHKRILLCIVKLSFDIFVINVCRYGIVNI